MKLKDNEVFINRFRKTYANTQNEKCWPESRAHRKIALADASRIEWLNEQIAAGRGKAFEKITNSELCDKFVEEELTWGRRYGKDKEAASLAVFILCNKTDERCTNQ